MGALLLVFHAGWKESSQHPGREGPEDEEIWPVLSVPCCMHWVPPKLPSSVPNAGLGNQSSSSFPLTALPSFQENWGAGVKQWMNSSRNLFTVLEVRSLCVCESLVL